MWEKRLYYDSRKTSEANTDRSNLDLSGFTLVDCPTRGKKETLDKKMIVDILGFAWERVSRRVAACVVLISSDGDYSYTISKLRDIGVKTIVIHGRLNVTADILLDCCDIAMSWHHVLHGEGQDTHDISSGVFAPPFEASAGGILSAVNLERAVSTASNLSSCALDGAFQLICHCVSSLQRKHGVDGWAIDSAVAVLFYAKSGGKAVKGFYKTERERAVEAGFIVVGKMVSGSRSIVELVDSTSPIDPSRFNKELYVRLSQTGYQLLNGTWCEETHTAPANSFDDDNDGIVVGLGVTHIATATSSVVDEDKSERHDSDMMMAQEK